ncbi:Fe-S cluster assembly protein SufD [Bacillus sp. AGMB 02131]|uniref:Fe-S cluster assembly protein SufD n=1 Tax=Peribacillus faecalis TaxID=2772559 RepID=A0A927CWW0_9BACI|nr:Fe-S cluster assembly protein SufD [Peribacillus faecalis]MBD3108222.1 Fe-S cluster assembly protein SufD [Peribacillus faecalis]
MITEIKLPLEKATLQSFSSTNNEPSWLMELREKAYDSLTSLEMPKPDKTNIKNWNFTEFAAHTVDSQAFSSLDELPEEVKALLDAEEKHNIYIQRNNTPAFVSLSETLKEQGVIFTDIFTAAREHGELVQKYFMTKGIHVDEHRLTALHAALMNGGIFIYVPKNVEIKEPLQAVFLRDNKDASLFNHVLLVADENSYVTYVENYISTAEGSGLANIATEVVAENGAKVLYGAVDTLTKDVVTYVNRRGVAANDATIEWALGQMNDGNTISENVTNLVGNGSNSNAKTVVVGRGEQKQNFTTNIRHFGKNSEGFILSHGVMKDSASAIFNGIGKIEHGASKANAEQETRVLMLSEKARGDANPMLLIDEDDVMAGHAASVGRVDPLQLYYLMSRGIPKVEAERLIIHGFLAPVVKALPIEAVKKQLVEVIERKVR